MGNIVTSYEDYYLREKKDDKDPAGSVFGKLRLTSPKQTRKSVKLKWKKLPYFVDKSDRISFIPLKNATKLSIFH